MSLRWEGSARLRKKEVLVHRASIQALLPGPDLSVRTRAAVAWQDDVLAQWV